MPDDKPFTMKQALKEARELLRQEFGQADQTASVQLATFLYGAHARDEFLQETEASNEPAYGGAMSR